MFSSRRWIIFQIDTGFKYSHQPYWVKIENQEYLFFCGADNYIKGKYGDDEYDYMPWKIYYGDWDAGKLNNIKRFNTGLKLRDIECSPYIVHDGTRLQISFIGGVFDLEDVCRYNLYYLLTTNLFNGALDFDKAQPRIISSSPVFTGFQSFKYQLRNWQEQECELEHLNTGGYSQTFYPPEFDGIRRIIGTPENPDYALITGVKDGTYKTYLYNLDSLKAIREIKVGEESVYKSCLTDKGIIHARCVGEFEERKLYYSDSRQFAFHEP